MDSCLKPKREVDQWIEKENNLFADRLPIVLAGHPNSGKSTVMKGIRLMNSGLLASDRSSWIMTIHSNIALSMRSMLQEVVHSGASVLPSNQDYARLVLNLFPPGSSREDSLDEPFTDSIFFRLPAALLEMIVHQLDYSSFLSLRSASRDMRSRFSSRTPSLGAACLRIFPQNVQIFRSLWADPAVQAAFARGPGYGLWESTGYFYSRLSSLVEFNQPSESDVLRARRRTVGIEDFWYEWTSEAGTLQVQLVELPFQLTQRKYGRHLNGNWVILCVALTSYKDVHTDASGSVSVFADSVALCQSLLAENSVIVYLTKPDQLQTTLEYYPLENYFSDYEGVSYEDALSFLRGKFKFGGNGPRACSIQIINGTDPDQVEFNVRHTHSIMERSLSNKLKTK